MKTVEIDVSKQTYNLLKNGGLQYETIAKAIENVARQQISPDTEKNKIDQIRERLIAAHHKRVKKYGYLPVDSTQLIREDRDA